uniref:Uncharacterized protein n=1 Tax=Arundo donax TaxID=35708 RepID=A0A0A9EH43_ARUDO
MFMMKQCCPLFQVLNVAADAFVHNEATLSFVSGIFCVLLICLYDME